MKSTYRHPQHDAIAAGIRAGKTNAAIAAELHVDRRAPARVRSLLGLPSKTNSTTPASKLERYSEPGSGGHTSWTGRRNHGTPVIRHRGREMPAAAVAFEQRTGRAPVGICRADCGVDHCLTPEHVVDDIERRTIRGQERALHGLEPQPWDTCPSGHGWGEHGRFTPSLAAYCRACNTDRKQRSRAARQEEETA